MKFNTVAMALGALVVSVKAQTTVAYVNATPLLYLMLDPARAYHAFVNVIRDHPC
jgi:hypothetical protein